MAIPLLSYAPVTQNARIDGYEVGREEQLKIHSTENVLSNADMDNLIDAAYRQIFFHAFKSDREAGLESQLRNGQLTVRDFIRGLLLSQTFKSSFYEKNSNYRFVEQCVQRVLGRDVYEREKLAWAVIVATKGIAGFIDQLLDSDEYLNNFGYDTVPYQRRRVLPTRDTGEIPFNIKSPRYDSYYRSVLGFPRAVVQVGVRRYTPEDKKVKAGDPALFLNMVRSMSPKGVAPPQVSTANISMASVPYRETAE